MTLWALETPSDYIACPSSEAALAVCGPDDRVVPWTCGEVWYRSDLRTFLADIDVPEVLQ